LFTLVVAYDMVRVGAVEVSTRPNAWQDWLAVKNWDGERFPVKVPLPRDALLGAVFDNQSSVHSAGLALEVFTLTLVRVNLPGRSASAA
jgi:hypothetical protein